MKKPPVQCFEVSWEVCNMVGGIHTVVSTKAPHMQQRYADNYVLIGPDLRFQNNPQKEFKPDKWDEDVFKALSSLPVACRMGRWLVPGEPKCLLVDFQQLFRDKDKILAYYWEKYRLDSLLGGPDYFEPLLFGHAVGMVVERLYCMQHEADRLKTVVHFHEWLSASTILYLQDRVPEVATVFTTHATVLGRAISSHRPEIDLPSQLPTVAPESVARELHVSAKHSLETLGAYVADCFTTVSQITGEECAKLLGKAPDVITQNGLGENLPSPIWAQPQSVAKARARLFDIAEAVTKTRYDRNNTVLMVSSGRYEFINKGIDLYLHSLSDLRNRLREVPGKRVIAFAMYPAGTRGVRQGLNDPQSPPSISTHDLWERRNDPVDGLCQTLAIRNEPQDAVHFVFVPIYLNGEDDYIREPYWQLLAGADLGVFPSWYEPWGYTPHEAVALGVPAVTSDLAGFGLWAQMHGEFEQSGVALVQRRGKTFAHAQNELTDFLLQSALASTDEHARLRGLALNTSVKGRWNELSSHYFAAHEKAMQNAQSRLSSSVRDRLKSCSLWHEDTPPGRTESAHLRPVQVVPALRPPFDRIYEAAKDNLWWSWNPRIAQLFSHLNPYLWIECKRDVRRFLARLEPALYETALGSGEFRAALDLIVQHYDDEMRETSEPQIAYFCMEYGLSEQIPLYAGGLGILAGDYLKTASDARLPMTAVGLAYSQGYFEQVINAQGQQENHYRVSDFSQWPMTPVYDDDHQPLIFPVAFPGRNVHVKAWKMKVGSVVLYLLDSDLYENAAEDRAITSHLYGGDETLRINQEWLLAVGGVDLLKRLKLSPKIFHINEGHSAFIAFPRLAALMAQSLSFEEALEAVRQTTVFTTHTAVPAGHDHFQRALAQPFLEIVAAQLQKPVADLYALGALLDHGPERKFSTTSLALSTSRFVNGVSRIHRTVTQQMFSEIYPTLGVSEVPVESVTNGVHAATWIAPEWQDLFSKSLDAGWTERLADGEFWKKVRDIPAEKIWQVHLQSKRRLLEALRQRLLQKMQPGQGGAVLAMLEKNPMIITHARRAAPYKRADLLMRDRDRLSALLRQWESEQRPVLFLYAGKAHPRDQMGQSIIQHVNEHFKSKEFEGRFLYLENYEIDLARLLVSGSEVWLNTPLRPLEASGTSGMKAGMNGCLNLSIADGWWAEGYNGDNGWLIGPSPVTGSIDVQNDYDGHSLLHLLSSEVVPLYFDRDAMGCPRGWVEKMKAAVASIVPQFSTERMLGDYKRLFYGPALGQAERLGQDQFREVRAFHAKKSLIRQHWAAISFSDIEVNGLRGREVNYSEPFNVSVTLHHPQIAAGDLRVEAVLDRDQQVQTFALKQSGAEGEKSHWKAEIIPTALGHYTLKIRVLPNLKLGTLSPEFTPELIRWL